MDRTNIINFNPVINESKHTEQFSGGLRSVFHEDRGKGNTTEQERQRNTECRTQEWTTTKIEEKATQHHRKGNARQIVWTKFFGLSHHETATNLVQII